MRKPGTGSLCSRNVAGDASCGWDGNKFRRVGGCSDRVSFEEGKAKRIVASGRSRIRTGFWRRKPKRLKYRSGRDSGAEDCVGDAEVLNPELK